jgi:hypothetical protein
MPKILRQRLFRLMLTAALLATLIVPAPAGGPVLHWEKIHVLHMDATTVFKRLGMTHSTKNGYTRDGKKGIADPDFPPGLTDVVPNDAEHILLVRGTEGGLSLFHIRVAAADTVVLPLHLKADLSRREGATETVVGTAEIASVSDGIPTVISLGDGETKRIYQITTRVNADGTRWISCRISLPLPPSLAASTDADTPSAVFVPSQVWTDPLSRKIKSGEIALFEDLAAFRQSARRRLGRTELDTTTDFTLRISLAPIS